jgi:hypothetical protein
LRAAPHGRGWEHYVAGVGLNGALFAGIGPPVGTFVFGLVTAGTATGDPLAGLWTIAVFAFSFALSLFFGYALSWKAALVTGIAVAVVSSFARDVRVLYASGALIGVVFALLLVPTDWSAWSLNAVSLGLAAAGAVAALVCTRLAAELRLSRRTETTAG